MNLAANLTRSAHLHADRVAVRLGGQGTTYRDLAFGCRVLEGYGLSETSPVASFNHPGRPRKPGSIGTPIHGVDIRVVDNEGNEVAPGEVGEIVIRGRNVMKGYWRRPAETAAAISDGWFRIGDLDRVDEDGYFFIVDRKKDMIIRGGYNVHPREIEEVRLGGLEAPPRRAGVRNCVPIVIPLTNHTVERRYLVVGD